MVRVFLVFCLLCLSGAAQAVPLRLDYTVTALNNGTYQYDFSLVADDSSGDFETGMSVYWVMVGTKAFGDAPLFGEGRDFITRKRAGTRATTMTGNLNGTAICAQTSCGTTIWSPVNAGDSYSFSGISSTLVAPGDLNWTFMSSPRMSGTLQTLSANDLTTPIPLPVPLALLGAGLLGLFRLRRLRAA